MSKKLLCVLNTFYNYKHIIECFDSLYTDKFDYFILENKSKYSDKIEEYFKTQNLVGYLQFEENITHGSVDVFLKEYKDLIKQYEYFTLTDGDLTVASVENTYNEVFGILDEPRVLVCCVDLLMDNLPLEHFPEAKHWIPRGINRGKYIEGATGTHMLTLKNENLDILLDLPNIMDVFVRSAVSSRGGVWAKTIENKAKHLTWDYYYPGNEYLEWKLANQWVLGKHNKTCNYRVIK